MTALVRGGSDPVMARYEYSAYGELLRMTGLLAKVNPFRFSTKFVDGESGLIYYGYRYYSPTQGRWLGRDPKAEEGGYNLYAFVLNAPVQTFDPNGHTPRQLVTLAGVGGLAKIAAGLFNVSSFTAFPRIGKLPLAKNYLQGLAVGFSIQIDFALGGRLLKSVGGPVAFAGSHAIGAGVGFMPHQFGFDRHQSLAKAVVTGRLEALGAIGMAAAQAVGGTAPARGDALGEAAYGFLQSARRGDTAWSDLDAALLGAGVWEKKLESWDNLGGFALDLLNRDAGSAFSRLPSYNALNAWDMALDMQDLLEGM